MASKTMNIWNLNGREPDSRDVYDANNIGLISGSVVLATEMTSPPADATKVEYRAIMGDGSHVEYADFSALVAGLKATTEVNTDVRTVLFINLGADAPAGLYSLELYLEVPGGGGGEDFVTHPELDEAVANKVTQGDVPRVSKGTAQSTSPLAALASGADLATVIAKVNEVISTLNTVRSTAGAGLNAANGVIDALQQSKVMKS